jgi:hypothetical protein
MEIGILGACFTGACDIYYTEGRHGEFLCDSVGRTMTLFVLMGQR